MPAELTFIHSPNQPHAPLLWFVRACVIIVHTINTLVWCTIYSLASVRQGAWMKVSEEEGDLRPRYLVVLRNLQPLRTILNSECCCAGKNHALGQQSSGSLFKWPLQHPSIYIVYRRSLLVETQLEWINGASTTKFMSLIHRHQFEYMLHQRI